MRRRDRNRGTPGSRAATARQRRTREDIRQLRRRNTGRGVGRTASPPSPRLPRTNTRYWTNLRLMAAKPSRKAQVPRRAPQPPDSRGPRTGVILTAVLGVAVIAACALLLSYNGIHQVAAQGGVEERLAHLYPGLFTLLLLMAFWATYLLRDAPRRRRIWVDALVLGLILLAAAASAMRSLRYELLDWVAAVVVAVAPWAALLVAFRLMLWIVAQLRGDRSQPRPARTAERDADGAAQHPPGRAAAQPGRPTGPVTVPLPASGPETGPGPAPIRTPDAGAGGDPDETPPAAPAATPASPPPALSGADNWDVAWTPPAPAALPESPAGDAPPSADGEPLPEPVEPPEPAPERKKLPKRIPGDGESAIRKAAFPEPLPAPAAASEDSGSDDSDGSDGFDDGSDVDVLADDPTSDEAYGPVQEHAEPAERAAAPPAPDSRPRELPGLRKRPMVLKPRRTGALPVDPPSGRVRSAPTPPRD